jgi:hypothetical protein
MVVQHVNVADGGQAIVGNVHAPTEGVGPRKKSEDQPQALRCRARSKRSGLRCRSPAVRGHTRLETAPSWPQWLHKIKLDGFRKAARIERGLARVLTRVGLDPPWDSGMLSLCLLCYSV